MVFFFEPRGFASKDDYLIYMGRDKYENEDLIKYALPQDLWFHVSQLSSAHVYLRLPAGVSWQSIPPDTLEDCAQLVKANSIEGHKLSNVEVVYTPASNLKKTAAMDVGQVGFHDPKLVRYVTVPKRLNDIINRLNKTKVERYPDLKAEREAFDKEQRSREKAALQAQRRAEKEAAEETRRQAELRSYKSLMSQEQMVTGKELAQKYQSVEEYEDDFM